MKVTPFKFWLRTLGLPKLEKEYVKVFAESLGTSLIPQDIGYHDYVVYEKPLEWDTLHEIKMQRKRRSDVEGFLLNVGVSVSSNTFTLYGHNLPVSDSAVEACCAYVRDYVVERQATMQKLADEEAERKRLAALTQQSERLQAELLKLKGVKPDEGIAKAANVSKQILEKGKEIQRLTSEVKSLRNEAIKELTA